MVSKKPKKTSQKTTRGTKKRVVKKRVYKKKLLALRSLGEGGNWNFLTALVNLAVLLTLVFFYQAVLLKPQLPIIVPAFRQEQQENPTAIYIPQGGEKITVTSAQIINGNWQTSDTSATHLVTSSGIGGGGNIVIYGHNTKGIFKSLANIKTGDKISLEGKDNKIYNYQVKEIKILKPSEVDDVQPTDYEVLTIYTCTGWLDSQRLVVKAYPVGASN